MDTHQERLSRLNHALLSGKDVCSSEGMLRDFPESLKKPFQVKGVGLVVCRQGSFMFTLNQKECLSGMPSVGRCGSIYSCLPDRADT